MAAIFVDAAAWIALFNRSDSFRLQALAVHRELRDRRVPLVTTEFVLMEFADAFADTRFRVNAASFLHGLRSEPRLEIVPASSALMAEGLRLYADRPDKGWSLTDCTSFVVMAQRGLTDAFTSDHHFEQAGFAKLL